MWVRFFNKPLYLIAGLCLFAGSLIASAPASLIKLGLAQNSYGVDYLRIEGTLWSGVVKQASVNGADLGDVRFGIRPLPLLLGRVQTGLTLSGRDIFGGGVVARHLSGTWSIEDADIKVNLTNVSRRYAFMGAPIEGAASLRLDALSYSQSGCASVEGDVWTDILQAPARLFNGEAFDLAGPVSCADGVLKIMLEGGGDEGSASLVIAINPDLTYALTADASPRRREVDQALRSMGFERGATGLTYDASGVFKGV